MTAKVLILHGPNLNLLGEREPEVYGSLSLKQLNQELKRSARERGVTLRIFQSNSEGGLIDLLHKNRKWADGVVFNPGAYTHYSYALRDAVVAIQIPVVEVHLSDIKKREPFRRHSVIAPVCLAQISGLGGLSYLRGMDRLLAKLNSARPTRAPVRLTDSGIQKQRASRVTARVLALFAILGLSGIIPSSAYAFGLEFVGGLAAPGARVAGVGLVAAPVGHSAMGGVLLNAKLSDRLRFEYGLLYAPRAVSFTQGQLTSTYSAHALQMPMLLKLRWFGFLSLGFGGYISYSPSGGGWQHPPSGVSSMSLADYGLVVSGDLRIRLLSFFSVVVDTRYLYGLTNLAQANSFTASVSDFQFLVGVRFGKEK